MSLWGSLLQHFIRGFNIHGSASLKRAWRASAGLNAGKKAISLCSVKDVDSVQSLS